MDWGNPTPMARLKRDAAKVTKLERELDQLRDQLATAEQLRNLVQRLVDRNRVSVPTTYLQRALGPRERCPGCVSAYVDCPVHS